MSPGETTLHMPVKNDTRRRPCVENPLNNTSDEVPKLQIEETTSFWTKLRSPSTQRASRGQRALGLHLGLVQSRNKHAQMSPRELGGVDYGTAREACVRR